MPEHRVIDLPLSGGIDEKTRAELVDPGRSLLTLTNVLQLKRGTHQKRFGSASLGTTRTDGTARAAGKRGLPFKDSHVVIDGHTLDLWSETTGRYSNRDRVPECVAQRVLAMQTGGLDASNSSDLAYNAGYVCVVYAAFTDVSAGTKATFAAVFDAASGSLVHGPVQILGSAEKALVVTIGSYFVILYATLASANITAIKMLANASGFQSGWGAPTNVVTDANTLLYWDAWGLADRFAVAYVNNSGGANTISLRTFNASYMSLASNTAIAGGVGCDAIAIAGHIDTTDVLWLAWPDAGGVNVKVAGFDATALTTTYTATTVITGAVTRLRVLGIVRTGAGTGRLVASQGGPVTQDPSLYYRGFGNAAGAVTTVGATTRIFRCVAESRPWAMDGRYFVLARQSSAFFAIPDGSPAIMVVLDVSEESGTARPVANIAPRLQPNSLSLKAWTPMHVALSSAKVYSLGYTRRSGSTGALDILQFDFGHRGRWQGAEAADALHMSGGVAMLFDGNRVSEIAFIPKPEQNITTAGAGITGTFSYVSVYEQVDSRGQRHISEPSMAKSVTVANKTVNVEVSTLQITTRQDAADSSNPVQIVLYRTTDGGATYYRVAAMKNDPTATSVTFADTMADATLTTGALLYTHPGTNGTAQPRAAPPSLSSLMTHGDRIVGVGDDGITLWPSGRHTIGEGMWFADLFQRPIEKGGTIVALASQQGRIVALKRTSAWVVDGDGPSDNGAVGEYSEPIEVHPTLGCIEPRSVATGPFGTVFQAHAGIHVLTNGFQVQPIGDAVQDTLASFPIITGACVDELRGVVYFTCVATEDPLTGAGTSGRMLVWNYEDGDWTVYDTSADANATSAQSVWIALYGGVPTLHWLTPSGIVIREDASTYLDRGAAWVTQTIETAWLKVAGLQGFQHLRRATVIAKKQTNHDFKIELAFDYEAAFTESETWLAAAINALPREQLQRTVKRRKCMAVKIRVTDITPSGGLAVSTGQGPILLGLSLEVGVKRGIARLGATAKA